MNSFITQKRLQELLQYDPQVGGFTWIKPTTPSVFVGDAAGRIQSGGYVQISIDGVRYLAHRLVWLYMTGDWPAATIDHIDGNKANNCWANLRDIPFGVNVQNQRKAKSSSTSGLLGAYKCKKKWRSEIALNGTRKYLGVFETAEAAHAAYVEAKRKNHVGCTI